MFDGVASAELCTLVVLRHVAFALFVVGLIRCRVANGHALLPAPVGCFRSSLTVLVCVRSQKSGDTALTIAASKGHDKVVRLLLQHGANINHQVSAVQLCSSVCVACSLMYCLPWSALICPCIQERDVHTPSSSLNHVCTCYVYRRCMDRQHYTMPAAITTSRWWRRCW